MARNRHGRLAVFYGPEGFPVDSGVWADEVQMAGEAVRIGDYTLTTDEEGNLVITDPNGAIISTLVTKT